MRYFKFGALAGAASICFAALAVAQPTDFAASANARVNYYRAMAKLPAVHLAFPKNSCYLGILVVEHVMQ